MEKDYSSLDAVIHKYRNRKGSLIPLLQEVQEILGYISREAMRYISDSLSIPAADIYGVATFYSMFKLKPQGRHIIRVCKGTACHVSDADSILRSLRELLGLDSGEDTTVDMMFTLMEVACLGCCSLAPVIMIDDTTFGKLNADMLPGILDRFRAMEEA